jgi:hypothetical protein
MPPPLNKPTAFSRSVSPQRAVAAFDSASAFLESLSRALEHRDFPYLGQARAKVPLVHAGRLLPRGMRRRAYALASGREGVPAERLCRIDMGQVAAWVTGKYARGGSSATSADRFPAVLVGSSNGALTHLAAASGIPWLPQTLLIPVRRAGVDPGDYQAAAEFGQRHAATLLDHNPGIGLHHMHDANQDELSASQMAYFRVKWRVLPEPYQQFLDQRLRPGAPLIVVRDTSTWPVTRYGDRHVFQAGAQGGMSAEDYLAIPGVPAPDATAAEAEWGFDEALLEPLRAWALATGHPVVEISYGHPQHPAAGVADTVRAWLRSQGLAGERLLVSSFIVHDPWRTLTSASVPFWTFFPVLSAADDLAGYLAACDTRESGYEEIDIMLFSHGVSSVGIAGATTWQRLAHRAQRRGGLLGTDPTTFPADFAVLARYSKAIGSLAVVDPAPRPMTIEDALAGLSRDPRIRIVTGS